MTAHDAPSSGRQGVVGAARGLGVTLDADRLEALDRLVALLLDANRTTNLTAIRNADTAWQRHVLDSLSLCPFLPETAGARVVDVGAGGGLPGLVLAIARPDLRYTLIDATGKKVRHMARFAAALSLGNVTAEQGRAEELARGGSNPGRHREAHDCAVARALAPMPVLIELLAPFVRPGGIVLAIKGERAQDELARADTALARLHCVHLDSTRTPTGTIVRIRKTQPTPARYPRPPGEPRRKPI